MIKKEKFLEVFASEITNVILGAKGSGKTNFASVLMQDFVSLGYHVWTNIHFFDYNEVGEACNKGLLKKGIIYRKKPDEIHVVSSLYELLCGLVGEGKKVCILDEAGIHASSSQSLSKGTVAIKQLNLIIRHFNCCVIFITQSSDTLPPSLRETLVDYRIRVKKPNRSVEFGKREVVVDDFNNEIINFPVVKTYKNIPHSEYPYDSNFPSGFDIDIDLKLALSELSKLESSLQVLKHGKEVLETLYNREEEKSTKHTKEKKPEIERERIERPTKRDKIAKYILENPEASYTEVANKFKTSESYVCQCRPFIQTQKVSNTEP